VRSVAERILCALESRLLAIDGSGAFPASVAGRVFLRRPSYDVDNEPLPALFLFRASETRAGSPEDGIDKQLTFGLVGVVATGDRAGIELERLLAAAERALELSDDKYLRDPETNKNLLSDALTLTTGEFPPPEDGSKVESFSLGIQCGYPHVYGDPGNVT
jgi:hypothetical protein